MEDEKEEVVGGEREGEHMGEIFKETVIGQKFDAVSLLKDSSVYLCLNFILLKMINNCESHYHILLESVRLPTIFH